MFLTKTDKARHELQPGRRTLGQRERALLLMADGQRSLTDFGALFGGREEAGRVARHLVQEGYLQGRAVEALETIEAVPVAADVFDGKPSLATTRMFLFDLCERMFVRRDPALAERFREALREARDRESMLATARAMLGEIAQAAGAARAEAIQERIEKLLPASPVH
ncbi:hypothetical protein QTI33_17175 [Variovorax sp. J22P271]|uniref:hypothetical protein n=1 Tax=Variovorax davisae TaxID=3053515 RepID=UPI002576C5EC|nr:hypothetical protein [Variovorax sp. J22P271]MDM0033870.1 hypothetical protein [Variovorax sp. J22P271]